MITQTRKPQPDTGVQAGEGGLVRYVPLCVWMAVVMTLLTIPFKILSHGFLPYGDARRHAAQAVGKAYTDVLLLKPGYTVNHSPGWDWLLKRGHEATGWNVDSLASTEVAAGLIAVFCAALPWLRRPEAWLAALLALTLAIPDLAMPRLTQGRPFLFTEAIYIAILFAWGRSGEGRPSWPKLALTTVGLALSVWIHGAWYLWILPLAGFALAGRWRTAMWLGGCWAAGTLAGAALTGKPIVFLAQALWISGQVAHDQVPIWMLVTEFRPCSGDFLLLAVLAVAYLARPAAGVTAQSNPRSSLFKDPIFWLIAMNWVLGFKMDRFWEDWGVPAAMVWLALEFEQRLTVAVPSQSWNRAVISGIGAIALLLNCGNDLNRRYSSSLDELFLDAKNPALAGWLPEPKGILYSADMACFYNTYYCNPNAEWRYVLGFEPALMPEDDLKIYRQIQRHSYAHAAYEPWIAKMRPQDRLLIRSPRQPDLPKLEWKFAGGDNWLGRLR